MTKHIEENIQIFFTSVLHDYLRYSSRSISTYFCYRYTTDTLAQFPQLNIKAQNSLSLNVTDAVYNANTSVFLGSKNISLTPYRITEAHYFEKGFLNEVGNVTNSQTFLNTYLINWLLGEEMEQLRLPMDKISLGYLPT